MSIQLTFEEAEQRPLKEELYRVGMSVFAIIGFCPDMEQKIFSKHYAEFTIGAVDRI